MVADQQTPSANEQLPLLNATKSRSSPIPSLNSVISKIKARNSSAKSNNYLVPVTTQTLPIQINPDLTLKKILTEGKGEEVVCKSGEGQHVEFNEEQEEEIEEDGVAVGQIQSKKQSTLEVIKRIASFGIRNSKKQEEIATEESQIEDKSIEKQNEEGQEEVPSKTTKRGGVSIKNAFACTNFCQGQATQHSSDLEVSPKDQEKTTEKDAEEIDQETRQPIEIENQKPDEDEKEDVKEEEKPAVSIPKPLNVKKSPLAEKHNFDVNVCEAMVRVVFPWAACAKN